jgi:DNA-binding NarL/FixJ family response regulator
VAGNVGTVALDGEDALFRRALADALREAGMRVVEEMAADGDGALASDADVVVVTHSGRRGPVGDAVRRLRGPAPEARILLVAGSVVPEDVIECLRAGACGYVLKDESPERIVAAVRAALEGQAALAPAAAAVVVDRLRAAPGVDGARPDLTPRERHVLGRLAAGRRNDEIAADLEISVYTVKRHVSHLLAKLGVENRTQAVVEATRRGLL